MNSRLDIEDIIRAGVTAPSGDNLQPWHFEAKEDTIDVFITEPDKLDLTIGKHHLYLTHGALIENLVIAADHFGYKTEVTLMPNPDNELHTASIKIEPDTNDYQVDLFRFFKERSTDRSKYYNKPLSEEQKVTLSKPSNNYLEGSRLVFIENRDAIDSLADAVSGQITLFFGHQQLHEMFYRTLRWTAKSALKTRDGLYLKTLRIDSFKALSLHFVLESWTMVNFLKKLSFNKVLAKLEALKYSQTGAFCVLISNDSQTSRKAALNSGRTLQRVWLEATKIQLGVQPAAAMFLIKEALNEQCLQVSEAQEKFIDEKILQSNLACGTTSGEKIIWAIRIGKSKAKKKYPTLRKEPKIMFTQ